MTGPIRSRSHHARLRVSKTNISREAPSGAHRPVHALTANMIDLAMLRRSALAGLTPLVVFIAL